MPRPCKYCGQQISMVKMKSGKFMPVDTEWKRGDGQHNLVVLDDRGRGHLVAAASPKYKGRETHFGTCPVYLATKRRQQLRKLNRSELEFVASRLEGEPGNIGTADLIEWIVNREHPDA